MKLTVLLICLFSLSIQAKSFSQSTKVNLNFKEVSLKEVFKLIEKQTQCRFFYNDQFVNLDTKVSYRANDVSVDEVLNTVLKNINVTHKVLDNNLVVIAPIDEQAKNTITGSVIDSQSGESIPGVSVFVKGSSKGTVTDKQGKFTLSNVEPNSVLLISFMGYEKQEVPVGSSHQFTIRLVSSIQNLDEVVVVGYGTQKKSDVTGSMVRVGTKELQSRPVSNALQAMQGKAAGVDITSNERPGEVGAITIRGNRSLNASNTPLYVVDGIPLMSSSGIETLNPADIETIDILKDASATAIYGSRGANGVVLVTTKKGSVGKLTFNYSSTLTLETIQDRTKMMTAPEYLTWRRWAYYYLSPTKYPRGDQPTQANDKIIFLGANDPYAWANIMKGWTSGSWDGSKVATTDWTGMVKQTGVTAEHNLSVSGGTDKMKAYASFGYLDTKGTMKGQGYTRYTSKVNVDVNPVKWFEMGASINTTYSIQQYGQSNTGGQVSGPNNIYAAANGNLPYAVPYDTAGNRITYPGGDDGIKTAVDEWKYTNNERKMLRVLGSLYTQFNILPGLKYRVNFGPDFRNYKNGVFIDAMSVNRNGSPNWASLQNQNDFSYTLDNLIYYDKKIGKHSFGATLLQTTSAWNQNSSYMRALGIPMPSQKWNALNMTNVSALDSWDSGLTDRQLMSYMGRFNYGFTDKYLLTVSGRWDGASQLADGHKWAFFPSAALAWRMEQEDWIKSIPVINQLKFRLGVGTTGNSAINPYQTKGGIVSLFYPYGTTDVTGYVPSESLISGGTLPMANQDLGWEKTTQYNMGIDFSILKGRISGVVDIYKSHTSNLLMQMTIPALTGYTLTWANVGATKNKGVDMTLNTVNIETKDFNWTTSINAAWHKDEIVSLANGKSDDISNLWFIGKPIGVIYGYASAGLWTAADATEMAKFNANGQSFQVGMARPVDQNGDYKIDPNNDRVIIGNTIPKWTVGISNTFSYKNFDLTFFLYGRMGYTVNTGGEWQGGRYVQRSISYYNENNLNATYQKPIFNVGVGDPFYNILGYRNGAFMKIRNVNLGYTFPAKLVKKLGLQTLKVYTQAENPAMLFSKIDWLDMDTGVSTWNKGFVFGLNIGF